MATQVSNTTSEPGQMSSTCENHTPIKPTSRSLNDGDHKNGSVVAYNKQYDIPLKANTSVLNMYQYIMSQQVKLKQWT